MPATYEALSQGGHEAMTTEIFTKIKAYLDTHGVDSKVSKAGDTMTGDLSMEGMNINFKTSDSSSDDSGDIVFYYGNGQEKVRLWTSNDYTAAAGINYRVYKSDGTSLGSGSLIPSFGGTMTGSLTFTNDNKPNIEVPSRSVSYINNTHNSGLYAKKTYNATQWYPIICQQTKGGGHWQLGNYDNENWQFVYGTKTNIDGNVNKTQIFNLVPVSGNDSHSYTIAHSGNVATGDSNGQVKIAGTNVGVKGLGTMAYQNTGSYPTTTSLPSNYRIRCWSQVNNWGSVNTITPFTHSTLASKFGVTSCTGNNTFLYCIVGDAASSTWYPTWCYYTGGNWRVTFNKASASQNYRLTFFGIYFG